MYIGFRGQMLNFSMTYDYEKNLNPSIVPFWRMPIFCSRSWKIRKRLVMILIRKNMRVRKHRQSWWNGSRKKEIRHLDMGMILVCQLINRACRRRGCISN